MTTTAKPRLTRVDLVSKVTAMIHKGQLDDYLERIVDACNDRRRVVRDEQVWRNMEALNKPGLRVRTTGPLKPRYILGYSGVVVERPEGFKYSTGVVYVDFKRQFGTGRRRYGPVLGVPANCLEEV